MSEALGRAAAADCSAEILVRTAVQALTWFWYVVTRVCIRVSGACSRAMSCVTILLVSIPDDRPVTEETGVVIGHSLEEGGRCRVHCRRRPPVWTGALMLRGQ